jgi:hypothetical protein
MGKRNTIVLSIKTYRLGFVKPNSSSIAPKIAPLHKPQPPNVDFPIHTAKEAPMNRLLKTASALSLLTATLLTTLPAQAQLTKRPGLLPKPQKDGVIEFIQNGPFLIDFTLLYNLNGTTKEFKPTNVPVGQRHRHVVPAAATNLQIVIQRIDGLVNFTVSRETVLAPSRLLHPNGQTFCFTTFGEPRNAKVNNDCR